MRKKLTVLLSALILLLLSACGSNSSSGSNDQNGQNEQKSEKIEGTLQFYTSQPDADAEKLVAGFKEKYPDVKVETFRSGTEEVISKVKAEKMSGKVQADVMLLADSVTFESLKKEDLLQAYESKEAGSIPEEFVDADHMYFGTKVMATALAVNTDKVKSLPKGWEALTSADAKDKVIMPSPLYSGAAAYNLGVFTRQNDFGWDFYESIKGNNAVVTKGNGDVLKAVASGEKSYGMVVDFIVARAKAEGSPVDLVYPEEGVPVITEPIGIMKDAKNAAAAKAFVDYVLSEDGQELAVELGYTPIREGISAPEGLQTIDKMKVLKTDINELYQSREDDKKKFGDLFGK
ncbi:ABC transporter substrate-binding protein [Bacillus gobiensis]|uniref:ABC transporter substrate-binding protein n=1 Tax=Bacillus gobiensis TaxID=1441095 RepID=UPI003D1B72B3